MELSINIPTDLNEVTLENYQKFLKAIKDNEDELFIMQKMLQYFCDVELSISSKLSHKDIAYIATKLNTMLEEKPKFVQRFTLNGIEFGFEPSLDDIAITAYADIDGYISDWDKMHKALAVVYRPITKTQGDKYLIEPYNGTEKYGELMKKAPAGVALGAMVFFWTLGKELLTATLQSMEKDKEVMSTLRSHNLLNNGDGMGFYIHLLEGILQDSLSYQKYQFTRLLLT